MLVHEMAIEVWGMNCIGRCGHAQRIVTAGNCVSRGRFKVLKQRFGVRICMHSVVLTLRACMQQRQLGAMHGPCMLGINMFEVQAFSLQSADEQYFVQKAGL